VKSHELIKDADHPPAREGDAERDVQAFPIPVIEDRQQPCSVTGGSNGWNFAFVRIAPAWDVATLVVTNQGGESAKTAANEASTALRELHRARR